MLVASFIFTFLIFLLLFGGGLFYWWTQKHHKKPDRALSTSAAPAGTPPANPANNPEIVDLKSKLTTQVIVINDEIANLIKENAQLKKEIKGLVEDFTSSYTNDTNLNFWFSITTFDNAIGELSNLWLTFNRAKFNLDLQSGSCIFYECDKCHKTYKPTMLTDVANSLLDIFWFLVSQHIFIMQKLVIAKKFKSKKNTEVTDKLEEFERNWVSLLWVIDTIAKMYKSFTYLDDNRVVGKIAFCEKCLTNNSKVRELATRMNSGEEINMQVVT